jgi:hypothetical protein
MGEQCVFYTIDNVSVGNHHGRNTWLAQKHAKPYLHLSAKSDGDKAPELLREFIGQHGIRVLNVAGPRASEEPDVAEFVTASLAKALLPDEAA